MISKNIIKKINSRKKDELFTLGLIIISFIISYLVIIEEEINITNHYNSKFASIILSLKSKSSQLFGNMFLSDKLILIFTAIIAVGVLFIIIRTRKVPKGLIILFIGYLALYFKDIKEYPDIYVYSRVFINNWTTYIIPAIIIYFIYKIICYNKGLNQMKVKLETHIRFIDYKGIFIYTSISLISIYILNLSKDFFDFKLIFKSIFTSIGLTLNLFSDKTISRFGVDYGKIGGNYTVYMMTIYLFWISIISNFYTIYRSINPKKVVSQSNYQACNNLKYEVKTNYNETYEDFFIYEEENNKKLDNLWLKESIGRDWAGKDVYKENGKYITVDNSGYIVDESYFDTSTYKYDDYDNNYINYDDTDNGCYDMYNDNNNFYDDGNY